MTLNTLYRTYVTFTLISFSHDKFVEIRFNTASDACLCVRGSQMLIKLAIFYCHPRSLNHTGYATAAQFLLAAYTPTFI